MSMAEYYNDRDEAMSMDVILQCNDLLEDLEHGIWTMKNGTKIKISAMKNSHLLNCINHIKRSMERYKEIDDDLANIREKQSEQLIYELGHRKMNEELSKFRLKRTQQKDRRHPDGCQKNGVSIKL